MGRTVGYMLTWTTYGSWLQGEDKGWVKDGQIQGGNVNLKAINKRALVKDPVVLTEKQQQIVREAILKSASKLKHKIHSIAVCSNHVHIVGGYIDIPIGKIVANYKAAGRKALNECGFIGRLWTSGYDKRYCFDEQKLQALTEYVKEHTHKHLMSSITRNKKPPVEPGVK